MGVLWLDDDQQTRIVHMGSGSGSVLTCVLADSGLDFLRLLAIGYQEICWDEEFAAPPQPWYDDSDTVNVPFPGVADRHVRRERPGDRTRDRPRTRQDGQP